MSKPTERVLRRFTDVDDLFDNVDNTTIWAWVNQLYHKTEATRELGKRYRTKQQLFVKLAKEHLSEDEIERATKAAYEKAEER